MLVFRFSCQDTRPPSFIQHNNLFTSFTSSRMKYSYTTAVLAFAICAVAAPLEKRQVYESSALDVSALPSISLQLDGSEPTALPTFSLPSLTSLPSLSLPGLGQGTGLPGLGSVIEDLGSAHHTGSLPPFLLPPFPVPSGSGGLPELPKPIGFIPPFPLPLGSGGFPELPKPLATGVGGNTYRSHRQKRQDISSLLGGTGTSDPLSSLPSGLSGLGSLGSLSSGTPSLSGLGSSTSGLDDLSSLGDLSSLLGGSSSDSSSGLSSLSSLDGSSSDLSSLRKEKRQDLGSLTSLLSGLSGTSSAAVASSASATSVASATSAVAASSSSASALGDLGSLSSLSE